MDLIDIQTLACGAYGWFQQALIRLCVCAAVALFAVLILRTQAVRDAAARIAALWREASHWMRLVAMSLVFGFVLYAGTKTNSPPLGMMMPFLPPLPQSLVQQITEQEIAQGWRLESVATNDAVSYAMPDGIMPSFNWHKRGTFGEWARLDLGDFAFPLGTNGGAVTSFSVFNDGRIRPTPRDAAREICAIGVPMLAMQGASRFWVGETETARSASGPYQGKVLTWGNFFLNADTNTPVNAQIELVANGDFVTRSNDVERIYRRVEPFDWDGDGLENTVDPNPLVAGADAHGTNAEWYNVVCSNVLSAVEGGTTGTTGILPVGDDYVLSWCDGINTNAYYFVDVVMTNGLAPIYFTGDRESRLGNPVVVARAFETNHVPLLIGINYAVTSTVPFTVSIPDDGFTSVTTNTVSNYTVCWPLEFTVVPDGTGYRASIEPYDPGCEFLWDQPTRSVTCNYTTDGGWIGFNCHGDGFCECDGCSVSGIAVLEEASFDLPDVWCGCWHYDPLNPEIGLVFTNLPYVAVSFDNHVVFYEDAYTNAPNDVVAKHSTNTTLTVFAYGGDAGGMLYVSAQKIEKLVRVGGKSISFPYTAFVPPQSGVSFSIEYEAETHSDFQNDISVSASMLPGDGGVPCTASASVTVVEILIEADAKFPTNKHRHVFGPAEMVKVTSIPVQCALHSLSALLSNEGNIIEGNGFHEVRMPVRCGEYYVTAQYDSAEMQIQLATIFPNEQLRVDAVRRPTYDEFVEKVGIEPFTNGCIGAAMHVDLSLVPDYVSFSKLRLAEGIASARNVEGFFTNVIFQGHLDHGVAEGAWDGISIEETVRIGLRNELVGGDTVAFGLDSGLRPFLDDGSFDLEIPMIWFVPGSGVTNNLHSNIHFNSVSQSGTVSVKKYDKTQSREITEDWSP